jgi:hypothetical protein
LFSGTEGVVSAVVMVKVENGEDRESRGSGKAGEDWMEDWVVAVVMVVERAIDCYNVTARARVESGCLLKVSIDTAYIHVVVI